MVLSDADEAALVRPTMTVEAAGRLLGVSRATAYAAAKTGDLPTFKMNGRLVVPTAEIRRMLRLDEAEASAARRPAVRTLAAQRKGTA